MVPKRAGNIGSQASLVVLRCLGLSLLASTTACRGPGPITPQLGLLSPPTSAVVQQTFFASNSRNWSPDHATLPHAVSDGNRVTVYNIRNCVYQSDDNYVVNYYDRTYDVRKLKEVDFLVVPFKGVPSLAHTMLSFGFADGQHLGVSVEARLEQGETYSAVLGGLRQFELIYVLADERDLIVRRTKFRNSDVYLYHTVATPEQARDLFLDVLRRVNKLYTQPEFYDTLSNNCTTNIAQHVNHLRPGKVPFELGVLLPGFSDQLAYELGLLRSNSSFEKTKRRAQVTALANRYADSSDFSQCIRR